MLKTLGALIKFGIFALIILMLGNWLRWGGRTISDQIRLGMAHAEKSNWMESIRKWTTEVTTDARKGFQKGATRLTPPPSNEEISTSERQKLRALIQELNSSHGKD